MRLVHRALLLGALSGSLLGGCGQSTDSGAGNATLSSATAGSGSSSGGRVTVGSLSGGGTSNAGQSESVTATPSTAGTFTVVIGASQTLSVTFNSSDGGTVSGLAINGTLSMLPSGWSGPKSFACATVSTGSGCVLNLTYGPTVWGPGSLTLDYVYIKQIGTPQTVGSITIPYFATEHDNVLASAAPTGQINAVVGAAPQSVSITFDTDDGHPATGLDLTTNLTALPAGWQSSATSFSCASVSTGNGCQLLLSYQPTAWAVGTLTLTYSYVDNAGTPKSGSINLPYAATTNDTVTALVSPSGQINAVPGGRQSVSVDFVTSDGNPASALSVTNLSSLPADWASGAGSSFSCTTLSYGNSCLLTLSYAPASLESGTLTLDYSYQDDSGTAKTATLNIPYATMSSDSVSGAVSPNGQVAVAAGATQPVTVTFTTDDGSTATGLSVTSGLGALPVDWTGPAAFTCTSVASGSACQLSLSYSPASAGESGTIALQFGYTDNTGTPRTASVAIPYQSH